MIDVTLPGVGKNSESTVFRSRRVSALAVMRNYRRSVLDLTPLFGNEDVFSFRLGPTTWHVGRSPEWTRHVIGSRSFWADIGILPLGLSEHSRYFAMGGLPGAPPDRHRAVRRAAISSMHACGVDKEIVQQALEIACRIGRDNRTGILDLAVFARALFLHATATTVVGITLGEAMIGTILGWFDSWSRIMSNPMVIIGRPGLTFTPAGRLRAILAPWYAFLEVLLRDGCTGDGLLTRLRRQVDRGDMAIPEAVGYLATILFAGTEPPADTLLWAYAHICGNDIGDIDRDRAAVLLCESFRVQPAVNVVVRRVSAASDEYRSASSDTYVVGPPLTHQRSNERHGLPGSFRPLTVGPTRLDPDEYPGLGSGAHLCIGARLGMEVGRDALLFLLREAELIRPPDLTPTGVITSLPRQQPVVRL